MERRRTNRIAMVSPLMGLVAVALVAPPAGAGAVLPSYHVELVDPPPGFASTFAADLFPGGVLIGYAGSDAFDPLAAPFRYRAGMLTRLEQPTESLNFPLGGVRGGLIAGTSSNQPYVWRRGVPILLKPAGGMPGGFAGDARESGAVVGAVVNDITGGQFPAYWPSVVANGIVLEGRDGRPTEGAAFSINTSGQIAGAMGGTGVFVGAIWDGPHEAPIEVGPLEGAINSELVELNDLGDAVGRSGYADGTVEAMLYVSVANDVLGLGFLDGSYSFANDVNNPRQVVGTSSAGEGVAHAFLWQVGVLHDLNDLVGSPNGAFDYLSNAVAIDDDGNIAAEAVVSTAEGPVTRLALLTPIRDAR